MFINDVTSLVEILNSSENEFEFERILFLELIKKQKFITESIKMDTWDTFQDKISFIAHDWYILYLFNYALEQSDLLEKAKIIDINPVNYKNNAELIINKISDIIRLTAANYLLFDNKFFSEKKREWIEPLEKRFGKLDRTIKSDIPLMDEALKIYFYFYNDGYKGKKVSLATAMKYILEIKNISVAKDYEKKLGRYKANPKNIAKMDELRLSKKPPEINSKIMAKLLIKHRNTKRRE